MKRRNTAFFKKREKKDILVDFDIKKSTCQINDKCLFLSWYTRQDSNL